TVHHVPDAHRGDELQQRDVAAGAQMNEELSTELGAVHLEPAGEPGDDEREQPPEIPGGKTRPERLPPAPRVGTEPLMREVELDARYTAEQRPEAEPLQRPHNMSVCHPTIPRDVVS